MIRPEELTQIQRDLDRSIRWIAGSPVRTGGYLRFGDVLARSLARLRASRSLLDPSGLVAETSFELLGCLVHFIKKAENHVREAEKLVARQQELVRDFQQRGRDCTVAVQLLEVFETALAMQHEELEALRRAARENTT